MPSILVVLIAVSVALIAVAAAVVAAAERQYDSSREGTALRPVDADPVPGRLGARLTLVLESCIDDASRVPLRNSSEAGAVATMRSALQLATEGEFQAEVKAVFDSMSSVAVLHDVSRAVVGGPTIDHLLVGPGGVTVVRSLVRTSKVTVTPEAVLLGRGRDQIRDPMIDDVLRQMAAVVALVNGVDVSGAIVFQDVLSLPAAIRVGNAGVRGVRLLTLGRLESLVENGNGSQRSTPIDVARVVGVLRRGFDTALPSPARSHLSDGR